MRRKKLSSLFVDKKNRKSAKTLNRAAIRKHRLFLEEFETRVVPTTTSFQQGVSGYASTQDTVLFSISPNVNFGNETGISVDQQDLNGARQGLLRFDNMFGNGSGQIPVGSTINSATLTLTIFNESNSSALISLYRMDATWDQSTATWNSFGAIGGIQASEGEAERLPDYTLLDPNIGTKLLDVTPSLQHWVAGEANNGWFFESCATNGWDFNTSEGAQANRPLLTVDYTAPSGAGAFQLLNLTPVHTEGDSGTSTALLEVARTGGVSGAVSVDYTITAGTATGGVDFVTAGPVTLNFAANQTIQTLPVTINGDTALEGPETVNVTLSNPTGGASITSGKGASTLTIADDDALLNEVLANVTNASDETNREFIELQGTPGASLNNYYFVVFEGNEDADSGTGSGIARLVINLNGQTFGSNGLLVITGTSWAYTKDAATNQFATAALDGTGGVLEDSSQTYALIRSPSNPIVQGTDYDTVGAYEDGTTFAKGIGVGILDQLPAGAQLVDTVGVLEGGSGDRDRVATLQYPGVHIHEPIGNDNTVTPDVITRRLGDKTPNSAGPWYNGEIENGNVPLVYAAAPKQNVVTPAGATVTPGAANILRNVFFTVTAVSVDESAGSVTLTVNRSGDDTVAISVHYATANGTAIAGQDYTNTSGTLNFAISDSSEPIVVPILTDSIAEGFETFTVTLSNATTPFQITVPTVTVTINDANVTVKTFQDGAGTYDDTTDATINSVQPDDPFGFTTTVSVDEEVGTLNGSDGRPSQGLLRFDNLFGSGTGQVPVGSQIFSGFLTLTVNNPTAANAQVRFFRMLQPWDEGTTTWTDPQGSSGNAILNGVTPDDVESTAEFDFKVTQPDAAGQVIIPVNADTLQAWANGTLPNYGWSIVTDSGNDWNFYSSDAFDQSLAPKLTILYVAPSGQGTFRFSDTSYKVNENGTPTVTVLRVGGSSGSATLNWAITPGTGTLADITSSATGTVVFGNGQLSATIPITINNDTSLERNETLNLTLTPTGGEVIDRPSAVLTIRDNDFIPTNPALLLNELYINDPGNDGGHEYIEFTGTPGAGMGSLYLYVVDGNVGPAEGSTSLVIDLGPYLNGSTGLSLVQALNTFVDFRVANGVTQIKTTLLDIENLSNDTATFALLYSPTSSLPTSRFDFDWDNDGSLELPAGVVFVDSIANKDNGITDQTYGPSSNIIDSNNNPNDYVPDAISRIRGNTTRNSAASWYHGDLIAVGDDPLVYLAANSVGLPSPGTAATPGEINTGTPAQSPLVSLTSVHPNFPVGSVTLTFNGPVTQLLKGGGSLAGIRILGLNGQPVAGVDVNPVVTGLGSSTWTLTFTGSGVVGGLLPHGGYELSFVGNSLIGDGRAVDTANTGTVTGSNFVSRFVVRTLGHVQTQTTGHTPMPPAPAPSGSSGSSEVVSQSPVSVPLAKASDVADSLKALSTLPSHRLSAIKRLAGSVDVRLLDDVFAGEFVEPLA